jgi:Tfp pilus assembly protein PilE
MKKILKNTKGITLVALVITIVILLILAGISISALTNTGIFQKAKEAKQKSDDAALDQNTKLDEYEKELDQYLPQKLIDKVNDGTIKVGDYISYTPDGASTENILQELATYSGSKNEYTTSTLTQEIDKETGLKWRVLDVKDGKVRLISDRPTTSKITLSGAKGYNNAVYLLDKTCKTLYNNSKLASNVQNLKIEDIQDYLAYDYTQYTNSNVDTGKYGGTKEYEANKNYPNIFAKEKTGWVNGIKGTELNLSEQTTPINETKTTASEKIKITQTYWYKTMSANDFDGENKEMYYKLFINNGNNYPTYWMSSRCVYADSDDAIFDVRYVYSGSVGAHDLYYSSGNENSGDCALRPVITLNSNVQVTSGNGIESTPFEIK